MTHKKAVLQYLKDFGSVISMEAFRDLGITRLAAVIYDLKRDGFDIKSEEVVSKNRYGKVVRFSKYYIVKNH